MDSSDPNVVLKILRARAKSSVYLVDLGDDFSGVAPAQLAGEPMLREDLAWPARHGHPLAFIAQIDCAALRAAPGPAWLPEGGMLYFFYDIVEQPWGSYAADRDGWAVLHDPRGPAASPRTAPDGGVNPDDVPAAKPKRLVALECPDFDWRDEKRDADSTADELVQIADDAQDSWPAWRGEHVGGYPTPVQEDTMELECQLLSNGIVSSHGSDEAARLEPGAADWRLLLEVGSLDHDSFMWGDGGTLYYWIREADALAGKWSSAWLILQCH